MGQLTRGGLGKPKETHKFDRKTAKTASSFLRGASQGDQRRPTTTFFNLVAFGMPLVGFGMGLVALVLHFQPKTFPRRLRRGRLWSPTPMWNKTERFRSKMERSNSIPSTAPTAARDF